MDTSWFDEVISWSGEAWNDIHAAGDVLLENILFVAVGLGLVGLFLAVGPSILLLLAGAPVWAALLPLLC